LPKLDVLAKKWTEDVPGFGPLWKKFFATTAKNIPDRTEHEHIGHLMICVLFSGKYPEVPEACRQVISVDAKEYCQDVLAILIGGNEHPPTERFTNAAVEITKSIYKTYKVDPKAVVTDLIAALHSLVSGTLDVDRLDYLSRDSHFIGAPYGLCDMEVLINGLRLAVSIEDGSPRLVLALKARAVRALDDMLWGRFQLFSQVLNHKTNAMLNALLAEAIPEAIGDGEVILKAPKSFEDFLLFTDDHVMSAVMRACVHTEKLANRAYGRALVHRKLPLYLGCIEVSTEQTGTDEIIEQQKILAAEIDVTPTDIQIWRVESALFKRGGGTMPYIARRNKRTDHEDILPPSEPGLYKLQEWCAKKMLPMTIDTCHFFVDREKVPQR
jgi:HD superfamily phosphohydrolase